jgi:hypothetical protein
MSPLRSQLGRYVASGPDDPVQQRRLAERRAFVEQGVVVTNLRDDRLPDFIRLWLEADARNRLGVR